MFIRSTIGLMLVVVLNTNAEPEIEFSPLKYQYGEISDVGSEKLYAAFTIRNTGDKDLIIDNVRPGCGCTVVKFDSIIKPGQSSKLESEVNIRGFRSGKMSKWIMVSSNAINDPYVRITIEANVQRTIDFSESFITLNRSSSKVPHTLTVLSKKNDLLIAKVLFKQNAKDQTEFAKEIEVKFQWSATDSVTQDGRSVYKLDLFTPDKESLGFGEFQFLTNHPKKQNVLVPGKIDW